MDIFIQEVFRESDVQLPGFDLVKPLDGYFVEFTVIFCLNCGIDVDICVYYNGKIK